MPLVERGILTGSYSAASLEGFAVRLLAQAPALMHLRLPDVPEDPLAVGTQCGALQAQRLVSTVPVVGSHARLCAALTQFRHTTAAEHIGGSGVRSPGTTSVTYCDGSPGSAWDAVGRLVGRVQAVPLRTVCFPCTRVWHPRR